MTMQPQMKILFDQPLAEIYTTPGLFIETLWQSPDYDDETVYAVVDSRTNDVIGKTFYLQVFGKGMQEGVIYRVCPYAY
jgi:hypothetical protein